MQSPIVVLRFSAMGDVAMAASVLKQLCYRNPQAQVIMVSRAHFEAFFTDIPGVRFVAFHPKTIHKGLMGLFKLFKTLNSFAPATIADLHDNIRSNILLTLFRLKGKKTAQIDKGRKQKKLFIQDPSARRKPLKHTAVRYAEVFSRLGYTVSFTNNTLVNTRKPAPSIYQEILEFANYGVVGIAPFAQHLPKVWPYEKMQELIHRLDRAGVKVFLFGGGKQEQEIVNSWIVGTENCINTIGKLELNKELDLISNLDLMISMDSSGMHMASLEGTRCLSIWGATHPYMGFWGIGQVFEDCIQVEHPSRPSSVYGNKPCICDGKEAIDLVQVDMVYNKVKEILSLES